MAFEIDKYSGAVCTDYIDRLKQIFFAMDQAYTTAAARYGFACDGCRDNCCRTRFYHHTAIEYIYLIEGLNTLTLKKQKEVKLRALNVNDQTDRVDDSAEAIRLMCPLNFDDRCILYACRPMICRLHGIPHELQKPGQNPVQGPGCETFYQHCGPQSYSKFDRTPFYRQMAILEGELRQAIKFDGKIRMTVAEMIISHASGIAHGARGEGHI